jgi:hypothetical protein
MTTVGLRIVSALSDPERQGCLRNVVERPYEKAGVVVYEDRPICVGYDEIVRCWAGAQPGGIVPRNVVPCLLAWDEGGNP